MHFKITGRFEHFLFSPCSLHSVCLSVLGLIFPLVYMEDCESLAYITLSFTRPPSNRFTTIIPIVIDRRWFNGQFLIFGGNLIDCDGFFPLLLLDFTLSFMFGTFFLCLSPVLHHWCVGSLWSTPAHVYFIDFIKIVAFVHPKQNTTSSMKKQKSNNYFIFRLWLLLLPLMLSIFTTYCWMADHISNAINIFLRREPS